MEAEKISLEFVKALRPFDEVDAVVLFGSHAANKARSDSDVDLLVIVQKGFEQVSRRFKGVLFETTFVTEKSTCDWWRNSPDHCVMLWRNAKVLYSIADTERRLRQFAAMIEETGKLPMPVAETEKRHRAAMYQIVSLRALAAHDAPAAGIVLGEKMAEYVGDYFTVRALWSPAPKERPAEIRFRDPRLGALLDEYAGNALPIDRKFDVAVKVIDAVFQMAE